MLHELPPTAGLPPRLADLLAFSASEDLEAALAKFLDVAEFQLESRGSAALVIALTCLQTISSRRTIIIPAYTCPIVVVAARQAGCRVVACDLVADGFDLDLDHLGKLIDRDTLCVLVTHYGGVLADVARVRNFVRAVSPEIFVLEDAAQAFGARWDGVFAGTQGDIGIFSFGAGKGLTLYQGGGLVARDADMRAGLRATGRRLVSSSRGTEARRVTELLFYHLLFNPAGLALAYGLPLRHHLSRGEFEQAIGDEIPERIALNSVGRFRRRVGTRALRRYRIHLDAARQRARILADALGSGPSLAMPFTSHGEPTSLFLFAMTQTSADLDAILHRSWSAGLGITKLFMRAIGRYRGLAGMLEPSYTPNAERLAATTLTLTTSELAGGEDVAAMVKVLARPAG